MDVIARTELEVVLLVRNEDRPLSVRDAIETVAEAVRVSPGQVAACVRDEVFQALYAEGTELIDVTPED